MKINLKNFLWTMMLAGVLLAGCGEDVNPDLADVRFKMKATTDLMQISTSGRTLQTDIVFREFLMGVKEVEFERDDHYYDDDSDDSGVDDDSDDDGNDDDGSKDDNSSDDDFEIEFEGRFIVDLLEGTSNPDFGVANITSGLYNEVEVEVAPFLNDGKSILLVFEVSVDGGDPVTVELSSTRYLEFEIEQPMGFQMDGGAINQILVLIDLDSLLSDIDFSQADVDNDGVVRINDTSNTGLNSTIMNRLRQILDAGEDDDYDDDFYDDYDDDGDDD